uniref:EOG090X0484 n=1 Tax=Lynceus sp. MCZ IZ 141354 TaxID=1930659 RepID=A0A9N6WSN1_9CRUS|nr:EOG090X0484 [Lynceus sp. MCZ IZ 141354]
MKNHPAKEKRRNSEKRKEKSRDAARCRRGKESEIFNDLCGILPLPSSVAAQLDKASVMRLAIAYLKARRLLDYGLESRGLSFDEDKATDLVDCLQKSLEKFLLVLSADGDIVYISDNITQIMGLAQIDLIGQSIYDYSHPCEQDEIRDVLGHRQDASTKRDFFLRLKCTLTSKGRNVNLKSASYKVIHCTGKVVCDFDSRAESPKSEDGCSVSSYGSGSYGPSGEGGPSHFLVLFGEPIPHPSNIEVPLDVHTFLTKQSLDMKYTYVDDKIAEFLGYDPCELEGKSSFDFHHMEDNETLQKTYKTLFAKGQSQSPTYRFLARNGGYVWIETQATLLYGAKDSRPQAVVCVHYVLSGLEHADEILSLDQLNAPPKAISVSSGNRTEKCKVEATKGHNHPARATTAPAHHQQSNSTAIPIEDIQSVTVNKDSPVQSKTATAKIFAPRTAEMNTGFLAFDDDEGFTVLKEEPEDLTHLAPTAGDACIPLDFPTINLGDLLNDVSLPSSSLECLPLTGFDFPFSTECAEEEIEKNSVCVSTSRIFNQDPYLLDFKAVRTNNTGFMETEIMSPMSSTSTDTFDDYVGALDSPTQAELCFKALDLEPPLSKAATPKGATGFDDMDMRAPYIPMGDMDDSPLLDCVNVLWDPGFNEFLNKEFKPAELQKQAVESDLAKLLQSNTSGIKPTYLSRPEEPNYSKCLGLNLNLVPPPPQLKAKTAPSASYQLAEEFPELAAIRAPKRGGFGLEMDENQTIKRLKPSVSQIPNLIQLQNSLMTWKPPEMERKTPEVLTTNSKPKNTIGESLFMEIDALNAACSPDASPLRIAPKPLDSADCMKKKMLMKNPAWKTSGGSMKEMILEKPINYANSSSSSSSRQSDSVLLNLLVSGHDTDAGYKVANPSSSSSTQSCLVALLSSPNFPFNNLSSEKRAKLNSSSSLYAISASCKVEDERRVTPSLQQLYKGVVNKQQRKPTTYPGIIPIMFNTKETLFDLTDD